jgi:hypothetical protein
MIDLLFPQAIVAAKKPAISISSFLVNRCGIHIGSFSINDLLLYFK